MFLSECCFFFIPILVPEDWTYIRKLQINLFACVCYFSVDFQYNHRWRSQMAHWFPCWIFVSIAKNIYTHSENFYHSNYFAIAFFLQFNSTQSNFQMTSIENPKADKLTKLTKVIQYHIVPSSVPGVVDFCHSCWRKKYRAFWNPYIFYAYIQHLSCTLFQISKWKL